MNKGHVYRYILVRDSSVPIPTISLSVKACRVLVMTVVVFVSANCNSYKSTKQPCCRLPCSALYTICTGVLRAALGKIF